MIKKLLILFFVFLTVISVSSAEGLKLTDDFFGEEVYPYSSEMPDGPSYTYSYRYPRIDGSEACADEINGFYDYLISDALNFSNPMMADDLCQAGIGTFSFTDISYTLHCNNGQYFSLLLQKHSMIDGYDDLIYEGHTFRTAGGDPGSTVSLPYLLGLLETEDNNDTWLQDRQTLKAEELTRELVWEAVGAAVAGGRLELVPEIDFDYFSEIFYPEEDFYLDENGDPVFFIQPGRIADYSYGLLEYPIALETLLDEF